MGYGEKGEKERASASERERHADIQTYRDRHTSSSRDRQADIISLDR